MTPQLKQAWTWLAGFLAGPLVILTPYIGSWNFAIPNEAKGSIVLSILAGLGLVNMKPPVNRESPPSS